MASINENLVAAGDLPYYKAATVAGLKDQLRENNLPIDGRKYDLYLRLRDAGILIPPGAAALIPALNRRPLSLLEWVGRRVLADTRFRTTNRTRIRRVIDSYLSAYPAADPPAGASPANNPRNAILYYFRDRADLAGQISVIGRAAALGEVHIVHLLIAYGADVNEVVNGRTAIDEAAVDLSTDPRRLQSIFALLGAGASLDNLDPETLDEVVLMMQAVSGDPGWEGEGYEWPRVDNLLALSAREFLADERSPSDDRKLVAMFMLWEGHDNYPSFL
ncbi:hypothetical protein KVR01_008893 [Diaporthe batatas]|uniref:uncharacterized protein n=1 Tax=Diaporthe batatas TaxID=748121 RepID=UPI001D03FEDF|nr:uncharacterized protein KVR01_008893 [Diaporthe batatas]KAG8160629.1 hypothetical protein KVR01_008893 [Diaporthe batatas]